MRAWLLRPIHVSWFLAWIAGGIVVGAAVAGILHVRSFSGFWLLLPTILLFVALARRRAMFLVFAFVFGLSVGLWRGASEQNALQSYQPFYGKNITLQGIVSEDTSYGPHGDERLMLQAVSIDGERLHGKVWVSLTSGGDIRRSDIVTISGKLKPGFGNLAGSMSYAKLRHIARPHPGDLALRIRDWFSVAIARAIPEPESSLGVGFLVGQRSTLPQDLDNELKIAGLTHAVVASGYNLTILVLFARRAFLKKSKYLAVLSAVTMALGFILVTGFSPSMTRAGIVTALGLAAWYYGRKVHPLVLLPLAAAITVIVNPSYVWGDIGWALSFAAFAGILILAPLLHHFFWGTSQPGIFREIFVGTMSAQLATLPIMIFAFGQYSPYALLANILVLPLIPLTMLLVFGAGIAGLVVPSLAHWFGLPASWIMHYMIVVVDKVAALPNAQSNLSFSVAALVSSYVLISVIVAFLWRKTAHDFRQETSSKTADKLTT